MLGLLRWLQPYNSTLLLDIDIAATQASIFSLILGVFFIDRELQEEQTALETIFTVFILVNLYFLTYWCWLMGKIIVHKLKNFIQKVRSRTKKGVKSGGENDLSMTRLERSQIQEELKEDGHD